MLTHLIRRVFLVLVSTGVVGALFFGALSTTSSAQAITSTYNQSSTGEGIVLLAQTDGGSSLTPGTVEEGENDEDSEDEDSNTCEGSGGMAWILCPIVKALDGVFDFIDNQINVLLEADRSKYTNEGIKAAHNNIRNIALAILLPIALVMVISTAIGFDFISAYTVKRALPRLIAAALFISLSWFITVFMIDFTNAVGAGTNGLITSPFREEISQECQNGTLDLLCLFGAPSTDSGGGVLFSIVNAAVQSGAAVLGLILFFVFFGTTLALAAGIAFIVLLARQIFIIALMLAAPLAILAWIFPGNDKLWKSWWSSFSKLLLMYPLIMAVIAVGRIFAFIINETGGAGLDGSVVAPMFKLAAYILPYAVIPLTFKFAGGVFATVSGMANDRSKGLFDKQRQKRAEKGARMKNYGLFSDRNAVTRGLNNVYGAGSNRRDLARAGGRLARGDTAGAAGVIARARQVGATTQAAEELKSDETWNTHNQDSKFLLAVGDRERAERERDAAKAEMDGAVVGSAEHIKAQQNYQVRQAGLDNADRLRSRNSDGTKLAAIDALAATGYEFADGEEGYQQLESAVSKATRGDESARISAMNSAQYRLGGAGRHDLAGLNDGAGFDLDKGLDKADPYTLATRSKPSAVTAKGHAISRAVADATAAQASGDMQTYHAKMAEAAIHHQELQTTFDSATGANKKAAEKALNNFSGTLESGTLNQWEGEVTGGTTSKREKFVVGESDPTRWTDEDRQRGYRDVVQATTRGRQARQRARGSRAPNPLEDDN